MFCMDGRSLTPLQEPEYTPPNCGIATGCASAAGAAYIGVSSAMLAQRSDMSCILLFVEEYSYQ